MILGTTLGSGCWVTESAVGKGRPGAAWQSLQILPKTTRPQRDLNCKHRGNAKKGQAPHPNSFLITLWVFPFLLSEVAQSYRSLPSTRFMSKWRPSWGDFILAPSSCFVLGLMLPASVLAPTAHPPSTNTAVLSLPQRNRFRDKGVTSSMVQKPLRFPWGIVLFRKTNKQTKSINNKNNKK